MKKILIVLCLAVVMLAGCSGAKASSSSVSDLESRIDKLEQRISVLESATGTRTYSAPVGTLFPYHPTLEERVANIENELNPILKIR
ncbi:MAG: hypothetical protein WC455_15655 [Dehalococcoidia bacterium]